MKKYIAFLIKDFKTEITYPFSFIGYFLKVFLTVLPFFFIGLLVGKGADVLLEPYNTGYFGFALVGIAFSLLLWPSLNGFFIAFRRALVEGTLESMLVTPTKTTTVLIASNLWSFVIEFINVGLLLFIGFFLFGINIFFNNIFTALVFALLTILVYSSIGLIGLSFTILFKKGNPLVFIVSGVSTLFSGTFFPIEVLPGYLKLISSVLPLTYGLKGIRLALLKGETILGLLPELIILLLFIVVLAPLSFFVLKFALKKAKLDGSLSQF